MKEWGNMRKLPIEQIHMIKQEEIQLEIVRDLFLENSKKIIYVTDTAGHVVGIIGCGDFVRYLQEAKTTFINKEFTYIDENCTQKEVEAIFREKSYLGGIPVLDKEGHLLYEYVREAPDIVLPDCQGWDFALFYLEGITEFVFDDKEYMDCIPREVFEQHHISWRFETGRALLDVGENSLVLCREAAKANCILHFLHQGGVMPIWEFESILKIGFPERWEQFIANYCCLHANTYTNLALLPDPNSAISNRILEVFEKNGYPVTVLDSYAYQPVTVKDGKHRIVFREKIKDKVIINLNYRFEESKISGEFENTKFLPAVNRIGGGYFRAFVLDSNDIRIKNEFIPKWIQEGVTVLAVEMPYDKEIMDKFTPHSSNFPGDDFRHNMKLDELRQVFGEKFGSIFTGQEQVPVRRREGVEYIGAYPIREDVPNIYLFGGCYVQGVFSVLKQTISYYLQERIGDEFCVRNCGWAWMYYPTQFSSFSYKKGDIVIIFDKRINMPFDVDWDVPHINIMEAFRDIDLFEHCWDMLSHFNGEINHKIADILYQYLDKNRVLQKSLSTKQHDSCSFDFFPRESVPDEFERWIEDVRQPHFAKTKVGALMLIGELFTEEEQDLIEGMLQTVDNLYVFIIEQGDLHCGCFEARYGRVSEALKKHKNILIVRSGPYIKMPQLLPEYYLRVFGAAIASKLGISTLFCIHEPGQRKRKKYVKLTQNILSSYGMEIVCLGND